MFGSYLTHRSRSQLMLHSPCYQEAMELFCFSQCFIPTTPHTHTQDSYLDYSCLYKFYVTFTPLVCGKYCTF